MAPAYGYKDGERLDKIEGLRVTVAFPACGYDTLAVKVSDPTDRLSAILAKADGKPIYVQFDGFSAKMYIIDGFARISAKADAVSVVERGDSLDDIVL